MKIKEYKNHIELSELSCFSVEKIFDCGQCFRFDPDPEGGVSGIYRGRKYRFTQESEDSVRIYNTSKADFNDNLFSFLSLDLDYDMMNIDIEGRFGGDVTIKEAIEAGKGIRILRQDAFETLISFIISQNNNIPRIKKLVEALCRECGEKNGDGYSFPTPEAIVDLGVDKLREMKTGFRAPYIYDAATKVAEGSIDLEGLKNLDTDTALCELQKIKGVGLKVASCVALFGLNKLDTFPVDVWIKRVLEKYYPEGLDINTLGNYRGLSQQYLFYYERYKNV
ncbi:MAG: DNA-3-methyladenine glycosylase 2 family protein [Clostridia bacterium]|nr:DNA-3-methyladenine glycosylase 2 family protein [Clostridia bacterium]